MTVSTLAKEKKGGEVKGAVAGRPTTEDVEIGVDEECGKVFQDLLQKSRLPVRVFSEHGVYGDEKPKYYCAIDPFDGSGLYRKGFKFEWFSVLTFFDLEGNPLVGGAADILNKEIYLADCEKNKCILLEIENKERKTVLPKPRKETINQKTWIAAYVMTRDYYEPLVAIMRKLWKKFPYFRLWPNGGAGIYHQIAAGKVHAYIMFKEPRSEIDPGLAFAGAAGYPVVSVKPDGTYEPYQFSPGKQEERVPFFITATSEKLIRAILKEVKSKRKRKLNPVAQERA